MRGGKGIDILEEDQADVNEAILAVMSGHIAFPHIAKVDALIDDLSVRGAECVILGCTEISNLKQLNHHAVLVDSETLAIKRALHWAVILLYEVSHRTITEETALQP